VTSRRFHWYRRQKPEDDHRKTRSVRSQRRLTKLDQCRQVRLAVINPVNGDSSLRGVDLEKGTPDGNHR